MVILVCFLVGGVKEMREVAHGQQQKKVVVVVEFFDTRDAARALSELRGKQVLGMQLMIEFNKPKRYFYIYIYIYIGYISFTE